MTPYQRIMRAAKRRTGCRLTAYECAQLARDVAISTAAEVDSDPEGAALDDKIEHELRYLGADGKESKR